MDDLYAHPDINDQPFSDDYVELPLVAPANTEPAMVDFILDGNTGGEIRNANDPTAYNLLVNYGGWISLPQRVPGQPRTQTPLIHNWNREKTCEYPSSQHGWQLRL